MHQLLIAYSRVALILSAGLLGVVTAAGCVSPSPGRSEKAAISSEPDGMRKLGREEIRRLIVGRTLSFVPTPGVVIVTSAQREIYQLDGTLILAGDRGQSRGRYRILADRLCLIVEGMPVEGCRWLYISPQGEHYAEPIGDRYLRQGPLRIIVE